MFLLFQTGFYWSFIFSVLGISIHTDKQETGKDKFDKVINKGNCQKSPPQKMIQKLFWGVHTNATINQVIICARQKVNLIQRNLIS